MEQAVWAELALPPPAQLTGDTAARSPVLNLLVTVFSAASSRLVALLGAFLPHRVLSGCGWVCSQAPAPPRRPRAIDMVGLSFSTSRAAGRDHGDYQTHGALILISEGFSSVTEPCGPWNHGTMWNLSSISEAT